MSGESLERTDLDPAASLAAAQAAARRSVQASQEPRGFRLAFVAWLSTIAALAHTASWPVLAGLIAVLLPLGFWYYQSVRAKARARTLLVPPGGGYLLLGFLYLQVARVWEADTAGSIGLKWLVSFALAWFVCSSITQATITARVKDANEQAH